MKHLEKDYQELFKLKGRLILLRSIIQDLQVEEKRVQNEIAKIEERHIEICPLPIQQSKS